MKIAQRFYTSEGEQVAPWYGADLSQHHFESKNLSFVPDAWADEDRKKLELMRCSLDLKAANDWLREQGEHVESARGLLVADESEIEEIAGVMSRMCGNRFAQYGEKRFSEALKIAEQSALQWGIEKTTQKIDKEGRAARLSSEIWWRASLRKAKKRILESEARRRGYVHKKAGIYVSDETLKLHRESRRRCQEVLERMELVGMESGTVLNMAEVAEASLANPDNRRAELMTRIRGFEELAKARGEVCEFVTLTAPSKFHRMNLGGNRNGKWQNSTPRDVQKYLCKLWARTRAQLKRDGVKIYGLRIAEPHHDGTPHWHLLLFVAKARAQQLRDILTDYAMAEDSREAGAKKNRIKFVRIDPAKGSAAGYVIKYVCKNLSGIEGEKDYESGGASTETAERVLAWASTWGIRQFQFIGGHRVGIWREVRRVPELKGDEPECLANAWRAANPKTETDRADWAAFCNALGGIDCNACDALVALVVEVEERMGRYGLEDFVMPKGVEASGVVRLSDRERWEVKTIKKNLH